MVNISVKSKKYNCTLSLSEKVTFILGDSGVGKTELTRRLQTKRNTVNVSVSNGFDLVVLTQDVFEGIYKRAKINDAKGMGGAYWKNMENFPYINSIIIIDDEDFVKRKEFAIFFNNDHYNYYIIINRSKVPTISYSANEIYRFVANGKNHYLEKYYNYKSDTVERVDSILVEGKGSDFLFFKSLFGTRVRNPSSFSNVKEVGKSNLVACLKTNKEVFSGKKVYLFIDFCAFGSDMDNLYTACDEYSIDAYFNPDYLSFEYMLLRSNFIADINLNDVIERKKILYSSLEILFTDRLVELTETELYRYSKSIKEFPVCYYSRCCSNSKNKGTCKKRLVFQNKDKIKVMLEDTVFDGFLKLKVEE